VVPVAVAVGVPEMSPAVLVLRLLLLLMARGLGRVPELTLQLYGGTPPFAVKTMPKGRPTSPVRVVPLPVAMVSGTPEGLTAKFKGTGTEVCPLAVTVTLILTVPVDDGVPEMIPLAAFRVRPKEAREPEPEDGVATHDSVLVQLVQASCWL